MIRALETIPATSFPPSFEGNPITYAWALFSLTLISSLSIAQLLHYFFEGRAARAAEEIAENLTRFPVPNWSPLSIHRWITGCFLCTIILGATPDVGVLLFWGEASVRTMEILYIIDRIGDGLTVAPFILQACLAAWAYQTLPQVLISAAHAPLKRPKLSMLKDQFKIVGAVLLIAVGVTIAKAAA